MLTEAQLIAGVAENNRRAQAMDAWYLRWIYQQAVPTGTVTPVPFRTPKAASIYRLDYLWLFWPLLSAPAFRNVYVELTDTKSQRFFYVDGGTAETQLGVKAALFTTPGVTGNPSGIGDNAGPRAAMPLNLEFPGSAEVMLTIRGVDFANPAKVDILYCGHQQNYTPGN